MVESEQAFLVHMKERNTNLSFLYLKIIEIDNESSVLIIYQRVIKGINFIAAIKRMYFRDKDSTYIISIPTALYKQVIFVADL